MRGARRCQSHAGCTSPALRGLLARVVYWHACVRVYYTKTRARAQRPEKTLKKFRCVTCRGTSCGSSTPRAPRSRGIFQKIFRNIPDVTSFMSRSWCIIGCVWDGFTQICDFEIAMVSEMEKNGSRTTQNPAWVAFSMCLQPWRPICCSHGPIGACKWVDAFRNIPYILEYSLEYRGSSWNISKRI